MANNSWDDEHRLLVRPEHAARLCDVSRSKLYQMLADGTLPYVRFGKSMRIPLDALKEWIARHQVPAR